MGRRRSLRDVWDQEQDNGLSARTVKTGHIGNEPLQLVRDFERPVDCPLAQFVLDLTAWRWVYDEDVEDRAKLNADIAAFVSEDQDCELAIELKDRVGMVVRSMQQAGMKTTAVYWPYGRSQEEGSIWRYWFQIVGDCRRYSTTMTGSRWRQEDPAYHGGCVYHHHGYVGDYTCDWEARQPSQMWTLD